MPITVIRLEPSGEYLKSFDPDAHAPGTTFPTGDAAWTNKLDEAMCFGHPGEAIHFYRTQSTFAPERPDGKPNRPLTAFTVSIMPLNDARKDEATKEKDNAPRTT